MSNNNPSLETFKLVYCLDGLVVHETSSPLIRGNILKYQGTLQPSGRIVTIKRLRFASEPTNEVHIFSMFWPSILIDFRSP